VLKTDNLDRVHNLINPFLLPIPLFCKSVPLLFKHLLLGQLFNLPSSGFPTEVSLVLTYTPLVLSVRIYLFIFHNSNKMNNIILKFLVLFCLCQRNNSYIINDISVEEINLNTLMRMDYKF
jgi:hypothetical protein